jgi:exodeoxyribonuclease VII small subunit
MLDVAPGFNYSWGMSKAAKSAGQPTESLPFEEALKQLEAIVETMESGDLPLENMLARYEEGVKLARHCQAKLEEAGQKIQQLEKSAAGEFTLKPLEESPDTV